MTSVGSRLAIALVSFALAWIVVGQAAIWLFGSGNFLVWVIAALVGVTAYVVVPLLDRRAG